MLEQKLTFCTHFQLIRVYASKDEVTMTTVRELDEAYPEVKYEFVRQSQIIVFVDSSVRMISNKMSLDIINNNTFRKRVNNQAVSEETIYNFIFKTWTTGTILLTWINFNPASISLHILSKVWDEIIHPFPNVNGCTFEVWEWISNFIPHLIVDVNIYPCCD